MSDLKACGVLVFRSQPQPQFLLMRHPTRWDLPKGHVDPGEDELTCALRELEEETGITRNGIKLDPDFRFTLQYDVQYERTGGEKLRKTLVIFLGRLVGDHTIAITEHEGFEWFDWAPPHDIQEQTINPLLAAVAAHGIDFITQSAEA